MFKTLINLIIKDKFYDTYRIYMLCGKDLFLICKFSETIKKIYIKNQDNYRKSVFLINYDYDWDIIINEIKKYSIFSESSIIEIHYKNEFFKSKIKQFLDNYNSFTHTNTISILCLQNMKISSIKKYEQYKYIKIINTDCLDKHLIYNWIFNFFLKKDIKFSKQVPEIIMKYKTINILDYINILQECQNIKQYKNVKITIDILKKIIIHNIDYQLYQLIVYALQKKYKEAFNIFKSFYTHRIDPRKILTFLIIKIKLFIQIIELRNKSFSSIKIIKNLDINSNAIKLNIHLIYKLDIKFLLYLFKSCIYMEYNIYKMSNSTLLRNLEIVIMSLCTNKNGFIF